MILNIPLCNRSQHDFWAWHHDKKGVFTVRSAYRMLIMRHDLSENTSRSNRKGVDIFVEGHGAFIGAGVSTEACKTLSAVD